jgi:phytoene dehydrogenase-like protein
VSSTENHDAEVIIVGAGAAGLACGRDLAAAGRQVLVLDASNRIGGRLATDQTDGFALDHGFQVLLTGYPAVADLIDLNRLELGVFYPGALIRTGGEFVRVADPARRPVAALRALHSPVSRVTDTAALARLATRVRSGGADDLFTRPEQPTRLALRDLGVSQRLIERFFVPFLGGVFLDPTLETSSRMMDFVLRWFSKAPVTLPAGGIATVAEALAVGIPTGQIRLNAAVTSVTRGSVELRSGETLRSSVVVVATDGSEAARLLPGLPEPGWRSVTCLYFAASTPPSDEPALLLNGDGAGDGPVNNVCVVSNVAARYAPPAAALISVTVLGIPDGDDTLLTDRVREQLRGWFGDDVACWEHLRSYRIARALPDRTPPTLSHDARSVRFAAGLVVCGDHRDAASLQGALASGRRAAAVALAELADQ